MKICTYLNLWNGKGFIMSIILLRTVQIILSHLGNIDKCKAKKRGKIINTVNPISISVLHRVN